MAKRIAHARSGHARARSADGVGPRPRHGRDTSAVDPRRGRPSGLSQPGRLPRDQRGVEGGRRADPHLRHHAARGGRGGGDGARGQGPYHRDPQGLHPRRRGAGVLLPPFRERQGQPRLEAARPHQRRADEPGRAPGPGRGGEGPSSPQRAAPAAHQGAGALRQRPPPPGGRAVRGARHRRGGRRGLGGSGALPPGAGTSQAHCRGVPGARRRRGGPRAGRRPAGAGRRPRRGCRERARARRARGGSRGGGGGGPGQGQARARRQGQAGEEGHRRRSTRRRPSTPEGEARRQKKAKKPEAKPAKKAAAKPQRRPRPRNRPRPPGRRSSGRGAEAT